jgi:hypothetical protein
LDASPEDNPFVARARLKWPDVPASYGWLGLDGRGRWLIQGAPISHPGIVAFLIHQYRADARGCWYVQNGPQRAFVDLELAPWILHLDGTGKLLTHTARPVISVHDLILADTGQIFLSTEHGLGALLDRDLAEFLTGFHHHGQPLADVAIAETLLDLSTSAAAGPALEWREYRFTSRYLPSSALAPEYGFVRQPRASR